MGQYATGRKVQILLISSILALLLLTVLPMAWIFALEKAPIQTPRTVSITAQDTPTVDPTVTALTKLKLEHDTDWWWNYGISLFSTIALLGGGVFAVIRWFGDRQAEREKQIEAETHLREDRQAEQEKREEEQQRWLQDRQAERERREQEQQRWLQDRQAEREKQFEGRFQSVVEGLGNSSLATQIGAAITLRTFLHPGYEQFYNQAFDLAVAHLRLRNTNLEIPEPLNSLSQALIIVFKESFPLTRDWLKQNPQFLDATRIQLDNAYLSSVDLQKIWMPESILRRANLHQANLSQANLNRANLTEANLQQANLSEATLIGAILVGATLDRATLSKTNFRGTVLDGAKLSEANLSGANLKGVDLSKVKLYKVDLSGANLSGANLSGANLSGVKLNGADLSSANLSEAMLDGAFLIEADLRWTNLNGAHLNKAKLYKARLIGSKLINASLSGADLSRAKLIDVNLSGADLSRAKLYGTIIEGVNLSNTTLTDADFSEAKLGHVDLSGSKLGGANSSGVTSLISLNLNATKMTSVKGLTKEQLDACQAKGAIIKDTTVIFDQPNVSDRIQSTANSAQPDPPAHTQDDAPLSTDTV